jgi:hypothetical protein
MYTKQVFGLRKNVVPVIFAEPKHFLPSEKEIKNNVSIVT